MIIITTSCNVAFISYPLWNIDLISTNVEEKKLADV